MTRGLAAVILIFRAASADVAVARTTQPEGTMTRTITEEMRKAITEHLGQLLILRDLALEDRDTAAADACQEAASVLSRHLQAEAAA